MVLANEINALEERLWTVTTHMNDQQARFPQSQQSLHNLHGIFLITGDFLSSLLAAALWWKFVLQARIAKVRYVPQGCWTVYIISVVGNIPKIGM
jgi:hypothetical protein